MTFLPPFDPSAQLIFKQRQRPGCVILCRVWLIRSRGFVLDIGVENRKSLLLNPMVVSHLFFLDMTTILR
jgi:hypothetical protein